MDARAMIEEIKEYGFDSPKVFAVMLKTPREEFVPKESRSVAYEDGPILIGFGQTISQPYTVAYMTDLLGLRGDEKVLEIGTGSGYQAAVLSQLASQVYSVERIGKLASKADRLLNKLGYKNVFIKAVGDEVGWSEKAPFDAIVVTAALSNGISEVLLKQLKEEGVMVAPVEENGDQVMVKFTKDKEGKITKEKHGSFHFVPFVKN